jgi:hypothetical protein
MLRLISGLLAASLGNSQVSCTIGGMLGLTLGPMGVVIMVAYALVKRCEKT